MLTPPAPRRRRPPPGHRGSRAWATISVSIADRASARSVVRGLRHPEVGLLRLTYETLEFADSDHQRLVVHVPADAATAAGLDRLRGRLPGHLRSVAG
ncbi:hypothetical protein [Micromonospora sp. NPDC007220]|uniref:MmyB family transcriptional regulator n=1 Tax=Micromonospora sp. NPDC007220 TaxID=3154318 RepID=UPI0033F58A96